ncbi:beta strand repeat-containing protein [Thiocystis violacea]|uniref:beta strand repeat-containing protein n=1 Tax=Thiocystis violacea TaxID=13725 RepID=UPI0019066825|nr:Calx-beta domain-containing protein [Thiocystis violacea]
MANIPGSAGNDIMVPTGGNNYLGGAGNDTYIITSAMTAGATAQITDTEGTNIIQLIDGLTIASSSFTNNATQLTLSNGAIVQVLGANNMTFQVGANATSGDVAPSQTYAQFAAQLGGSVPAAGAPAVAGTPNFSVPSNGTPTTPTLSFASTAVSLIEGNSGTTNMTFTVNLSAAQTSAVTVNYATANGTATAGSDYTAAAGTLTFAAGETSKTVTVPVIGDTTFEPNETFSVTLSSPTLNGAAAGIALATANVATGTITNDDTNQAPVVTSIPGAQGTTVTAQPGAVTAAGLFGDYTVADADTTLLTVTISAGNGLVRLTDPAALLSYSNTYVPGTNAATITAQGSQVNLSNILDTIQYTASGAGGSTDTLTIVVTDGTTPVTKTVPIQVAATQYLSAGNDNLIGTAFGDLFLGTNAAGTAEFTVGALDVITGNGGTDILRFSQAQTAGALVASAAGAITSVEQVEIATVLDTSIADDTDIFTLDASLVGGLQTITFTAAAEPAVGDRDSLTVTKLTDTQTVVVTSNAELISVGHLSATAGVETLNVALTGGVSLLDGAVPDTGGITATSGGAGDILKISSTGNTANSIGTLTTNDAAQSVVISGNANLAIADVVTGAVIDARLLTGNLTLGYNLAADGSIQTGIGADTINIGTLAVGDNVISTGAGNDTITLDNLAIGDNVITGGAGADTVTVSTNAGAVNDILRFGDGDSPLVTVSLGTNNTLDTGDTFTFAGARGDVVTATGNTALTAGETFAFTGTQTLASITMPNSGVVSDGQYGVVLGNYNATTGVFTVDTGAGTSTLVVYDGDNTAAVSQSAIVLLGTAAIATLNADGFVI